MPPPARLLLTLAALDPWLSLITTYVESMEIGILGLPVYSSTTPSPPAPPACTRPGRGRRRLVLGEGPAVNPIHLLSVNKLPSSSSSSSSSMFRGGFNQKRVRQRGHILWNISIFPEHPSGLHPDPGGIPYWRFPCSSPALPSLTCFPPPPPSPPRSSSPVPCTASRQTPPPTPASPFTPSLPPTPAASAPACMAHGSG